MADRSAAAVWVQNGSKDMLEQAQHRVKEILSAHYPSHLDPKIDTAIRDKFPIRLAKKDIQVGNGRW